MSLCAERARLRLSYDCGGFAELDSRFLAHWFEWSETNGGWVSAKQLRVAPPSATSRVSSREQLPRPYANSRTRYRVSRGKTAPFDNQRPWGGWKLRMSFFACFSAVRLRFEEVLPET
jgi:hypothetical protein